MKRVYSRLVSSISIGVLLSGCAFVEMSGTMTKKTGEVMTDYSKKNEGFLGALAGIGGNINTAVGSTVENIGNKGKTDDSSASKTEQFVSANKEVTNAAFNAVSNKAISKKAAIQAQKRLKELGYYQGDLDGMLGKQTIISIEKYQIDNKLEVTKILDQPTLASLGIAK